MCGIAGIALEDGGTPARETLERMAERIRHRGPDEDGFLRRPGVGLAFRRLVVIDPSTGSQPQRNEDGRIHVVFNGEIYNHAELRAELTSRGHRFRTASDTEVLVHLYEERGRELVHALNGMFAFAIWDEREQSLLLARDRVGIKPLLWAEVPGGIAFGSEAGAVLAAGGVDQSLDPEAVHHHLSWGAVPSPRTLLRGMHRLGPGERLVWKGGRVSTDAYWHPLSGAASAPETYAEGCARLRELLEDSVRLRMRSDVPLGAFLSGGVDSTAIVGLMAAHGRQVSTFSVGFGEDPVFDETSWAMDASLYHGTRHSATQLGSQDLVDLVPRVLDALEEPFGGASLLPTWVVARETRRAVTVALSGDGADELFAGYDRYLGEAYRSWWQRIPAPARSAAIAPLLRALPVSRGTRWGELARKGRRFLDGVEGDAAERHTGWMRFASADDVFSLVGEHTGRDPVADLVRETHADHDARAGRSDLALPRALFTDFRVALPSDMLRKVDTASMLHSLEVRVPFLDHRVVELAMAMPGAWKMRGGARKRVLKDAVEDLLPPSVRRRPKAGFDVPVGEWLKSSLRDLFWDTVSSPGAVPLDRGVLERWYDEHCQGRRDRTKVLWAAFTLRWWESRSRAEAAEPDRVPAGAA